MSNVPTVLGAMVKSTLSWYCLGSPDVTQFVSLPFPRYLVFVLTPGASSESMLKSLLLQAGAARHD
jgi:hypothetical protein